MFLGVSEGFREGLENSGLDWFSSELRALQRFSMPVRVIHGYLTGSHMSFRVVSGRCQRRFDASLGDSE